MLSKTPKPKALHLSVMGRNHGDTVLNLAIQQMLSERFEIRHHDILKQKFPDGCLENFQQYDLIILGGGGLIHSYNPRGEPWPHTGTMWNMPLEQIQLLKPQIVLYGVGYNHFYGEPPPTERMRQFFDVLLEKGAIISFRNDGSLERIREHIPQLRNRAQTIPDPGIFYRAGRGIIPSLFSHTGHAVLQIAADRPALRYGENFEGFLGLLRDMKSLSDSKFLLLPHTPDDRRLYRKLDLAVPVARFRASVGNAKRAMRCYAAAPFSITTRGHGQICSIGNGTPNFSISTHPKVSAFAENCKQQDWCVSFKEYDRDTVLSRFVGFLENLDSTRAELVSLNQEFDRHIANFNQKLFEIF